MSLNGDQAISESSRGSFSASGRGGGYRPKKRLTEQLKSLELEGTIESDEKAQKLKIDGDGEAQEVMETSKEEAMEFSSNQQENKPLISKLEDSTDSDDSDFECSKIKKRCDFCGESDHLSRTCPIIVQLGPSNGQDGNRNANKIITCYYCHEEGHVKADCPKRSCCYYCKKEGHVKADCPEKTRQESSKKRERVKLNYTFRKMSNLKKENEEDSASKAASEFYEGPAKDNELAKETTMTKKSPVIVPYPIPASQVKPQVQLRSKLSSDSDISVAHKVVRSESSEEEEMDSFGNSEDESEGKGTKKGEESAKENASEDTVKGKKEGDIEGEGDPIDANKPDEANELQTISIEIDGCVEFDSGDDYYDCSEGEGGNKGDGKLNRIIEEDDFYGEDGAMLLTEELSNIEADQGECEDVKEVKEAIIVEKETVNEPIVEEKKKMVDAISDEKQKAMNAINDVKQETANETIVEEKQEMVGEKEQE